MVKEIINVTCGKTFTITGNLKAHIIAVHYRQKDHNCNSCGKAFSQAKYMNKHINTVHN